MQGFVAVLRGFRVWGPEIQVPSSVLPGPLLLEALDNPVQHNQRCFNMTSARHDDYDGDDGDDDEYDDDEYDDDDDDVVVVVAVVVNHCQSRYQREGRPQGV